MVSALQGLGSVIIDAQTALLRAAESAGAERFIPSDFSADLFGVDPGENRNFDLRRTFAALLDGSAISGTSVLNGMFTDMLLFGHPCVHADAGTFDLWGELGQLLDMTSVADTAKFTAAVATDQDETPRVLRFAGESLTLDDVRQRCEVWLGRSLQPQHRGSVDDLTELIGQQMRENPGQADDGFPLWQGLQYPHDMVSGKAQFESIDNDRYSDVQPQSVAEFLQDKPAPN